MLIKHIYNLLMLLGALTLSGQNISPQVLNSAGTVHTVGNGFTLSDNVGEAFVTTIGNGPTLTQGFLQPLRVVIPQFSLEVMPSDVSCQGKGDGRIVTNLYATTDNFVVNYLWTPTTVCTSGSCT